MTIEIENITQEIDRYFDIEFDLTIRLRDLLGFVAPFMDRPAKK